MNKRRPRGSVPQAILDALKGTDGLSQATICTVTSTEQAHISRSLHKLKDQGLIERKPLREGCKFVKWVGK